MNKRRLEYLEKLETNSKCEFFKKILKNKTTTIVKHVLIFYIKKINKPNVNILDGNDKE